MSHQPDSNDRRNKNSSMAAFGFVLIVIILIVSAANYLRIQKPRFQDIEKTEKNESLKTPEEHSASAVLFQQPVISPVVINEPA